MPRKRERGRKVGRSHYSLPKVRLIKKLCELNTRWGGGGRKKQETGNRKEEGERKWLLKSPVLMRKGLARQAFF